MDLIPRRLPRRSPAKLDEGGCAMRLIYVEIRLKKGIDSCKRIIKFCQAILIYTFLFKI